ncbi:hypothetical protein Mapa_011810 [Marchantia paleacea]|nr:hypothetical protein Mapa_011810 [Marchantia paleacea]
MENIDMFNNATAQLTFHDFLDRMRHPSAADLVRSIKTFIGAFLNNPPDPEKDSQSVQEFLASTEYAFKAHPLWAGATDEELESSGEGLEKYLMTKLWPRAFSPVPEDAEIDQRLSEKMTILQEFIRPEHLDIPKNSQNETSWLLAQKELQKINTYKAPRDKLVCILNCCRVINNLLVNVSMASNDNPPGADDFLPVLIYVVIKANPPQLHSNLQYILRYRHQGRLVSEAAYFYTNLVSAESFIRNLDSSSLSMDPAEFEKRMQAGRLAMEGVNGVSSPSVGTEKEVTASDVSLQKRTKSPSKPVPSTETDRGPGAKKEEQIVTKDAPAEAEGAPVVLSADKLEAGAAAQVMEADKAGQLSKDYPFLYSSAGDLRVMDVEELLHEYKELVLRYVALRKAVESSVTSEKPSTFVQKQDAETQDVVPAGSSVGSDKPSTIVQKQETETQDAVPLDRGDSVLSGISGGTQSTSQPSAKSDLRDEVSAGELLDAVVIDSNLEAHVLPEGNTIPPHVGTTKSEEVSPDTTKRPLSASQNLTALADAEDVSDLQGLDTRDLGPLEVAEEKKAVEKTELENLEHADESNDKPNETTVSHEGSPRTQSRLEEQ